MMQNDFNAILDDLLARWHSWARAYSAVPTCSANPMFRNAKSANGWDDSSDVVDGAVADATMKAMDFQVGEMQEPHRSAIYMHARNCSTGRNVWTSPRLPTCPMERTVILTEAKNMLARRLLSVGVM